MIVSHYQKKNILLFCRSSPINHNLLPGKSTARCSFQEWSQHLQSSATIFNGRCADWMEKADWILLTLYFVCYDLWRLGRREAKLNEEVSLNWLCDLGCHYWSAWLCHHDTSAGTNGAPKIYFFSLSECVSRQLVSFLIAQKNPADLCLCCSLHGVKRSVGSLPGSIFPYLAPLARALKKRNPLFQ